MNRVLRRVLRACDDACWRRGAARVSPSTPAETIYSGGDIITMEGDTAAYAEAVAVTGGKIAFVGSKADADKLKGRATVMHDLHGKTLIPGLIDGHAHFAGFGAQAVAANLLASPDGDANSIPDIIRILKEWYAANGTKMTNGWILGMGFDDAVLAEGRFPTRDDLDQVSTDVPVIDRAHLGSLRGDEQQGARSFRRSRRQRPILPAASSGGVPARRSRTACWRNWPPFRSSSAVEPGRPEAVTFFMDKGQELADVVRLHHRPGRPGDGQPRATGAVRRIRTPQDRRRELHRLRRSTSTCAPRGTAPTTRTTIASAA